jgi:hypothetical protein
VTARRAQDGLSEAKPILGLPPGTPHDGLRFAQTILRAASSAPTRFTYVTREVL